MNAFKRLNYTLLLSYNPCDIFTHYNIKEMHGLNIKDCEAYNNTSQDAYISGLCNFVPNSDDKFVFINLNRCNNDIKTFGLIMHELMHLSFGMHNYDISKEEDIITWAESEAYKVFKIIKRYEK